MAKYWRDSRATTEQARFNSTRTKRPFADLCRPSETYPNSRHIQFCSISRFHGSYFPLVLDDAVVDICIQETDILPLISIPRRTNLASRLRNTQMLKNLMHVVAKGHFIPEQTDRRLLCGRGV